MKRIQFSQRNEFKMPQAMMQLVFQAQSLQLCWLKSSSKGFGNLCSKAQPKKRSISAPVDNSHAAAHFFTLTFSMMGDPGLSSSTPDTLSGSNSGLG